MIIKDKTLGNFEVHCDGDNYTLVEDTGRINKKGEAIFKTYGHFSSLSSALNRYIKQKLDYSDNTYDLQEYLSAIKKEKHSLNHFNV